MSRIDIKRFSAPDETRPFADEKGRAEILNFSDGVVGLGRFEPEWRWSKHVKPIAGTDSCLSQHSCYVIAGRMRIRMDDGEEAECGPGDVVMVPPGHDAWVVGDETCVIIDFSGMETYAAKARPRAQPQQPAPGAPAHSSATRATT
jgi:hypothetical protein